jgi:CHAT domain-containing protein
MRGFYRNISDQLTSRDQATALALVQRKLMFSKDFSHPFYWAPFVLVGPQANATAQI